MLEALYKLFAQEKGALNLSGDIWLIAMIAVVVIAFLVTLVLGLTLGTFNKTKSVMKRAVAKPASALAAIKQLPANEKAQYKNARIGNLKPSMLVTKQACVDEPYKRSFISKVWLVTLAATLICGLIAFFIMPLQAMPAKPVVPDDATAESIAEILKQYENAVMAAQTSMYIAPIVVLVLGGLLTLAGGIVGHVMYNGASNLYGKFIKVLDGDQAAAGQAYSEPQQTYAEPQQAYAEPQQPYAEPGQGYAEPQQAYAEPQQPYVEPQQAYAESQQSYAEPVTAAPQESDEEIRRRAREEALAQMRAQQAQAQAQAQAARQAQAQPQAQARPQQAQPQAAASDSATVEEVIAKIDQIERDGAPREVMREVATLLQKERAKPENKTPERQKRLNEALSKLLKAMSGARK